VDKIQIGTGKRGKITQAVQNAFFNIFKGKTKIPENWLSPIK
jgi:branched-chain amino acid aminotransferase